MILITKSTRGKENKVLLECLLASARLLRCTESRECAGPDFCHMLWRFSRHSGISRRTRSLRNRPTEQSISGPWSRSRSRPEGSRLMAVANHEGFQHCSIIEMGGCRLACVTQLDTRCPTEANIPRCGCDGREVNDESGGGSRKRPHPRCGQSQCGKCTSNRESHASSAHYGWCPVGNCVTVP